MKQLTNYNNRLMVAIAMLLLTATACTKTVTNGYPAASKSRIESFTIINAPTPIAGVVDDNDHTITVYIPPTQFLTVLQPAIITSEGATVSSSAGDYVQNLPDYFTKKSTITYTVTGTDKTVTTYSLNIISQQPPLSFQEVTTDVANPASYNQVRSNFTNTITIYTSQPYVFSASSDVSTAVSRGYLVNASGKEYPLTGGVNFSGAGDGGSSYVNFSLSAVTGYNAATALADQNAPPPGLYWIKVQYYSQVTTLKNPIKIFYE